MTLRVARSGYCTQVGAHDAEVIPPCPIQWRLIQWSWQLPWRRSGNRRNEAPRPNVCTQAHASRDSRWCTRRRACEPHPTQGTIFQVRPIQWGMIMTRCRYDGMVSWSVLCTRCRHHPGVPLKGRSRTSRSHGAGAGSELRHARTMFRRVGYPNIFRRPCVV